jgi:hypothetical protein
MTMVRKGGGIVSYQAVSQLQNDCVFGMDHTLLKVDLDVVGVVAAVVVVVVGVEVVLSTRKLPHKRESLLSALCLCPPEPTLTRSKAASIVVVGPWQSLDGCTGSGSI